MKILKKYTTSEGNELEFCQFDHLGENVLVVIDNSCQIEKTYRLGNYYSFDYGKSTVKLTNFYQVFNAWINEKINF